ncbi:MAG: hypothetical protein ACXVCY_01435 [Pseudobdellovibrionaceae bacterium]
MTKKFLFYLIFFISIPAVALKGKNANDCSDEDFSDKMGPVRQQGNFGWCYAFTAADLIAYKLKLTPSNTVSAFDVGIGYYFQENIVKPKLDEKDFSSEQDYLDAKKDWQNYLQELKDRKEKQKAIPLSMREGGTIDGAIRSYNFKGGLCSEKQLPSQKSEVFIDADFYLQTNLLTAQYGPPIQSFNMDCELQSNDLLVNSNMVNGLLNAAPMENLTEKMIDAAAVSTVKLLDQKCSPRTSMPLLMAKSRGTDTVESRKTALKRINENITHRIPTGISYSSCFLTDNPKSYPKFFNHEPSCPHASSIVGRRMNSKTHKCEYKIRNSWGLSCEPYSKKIKENKKCENGHVWISEDELWLSLRGITWLP